MGRKKKFVCVAAIVVATLGVALFGMWARSTDGRILSDSRFVVTQDVRHKNGAYAPTDAHPLVRELYTVWNNCLQEPADTTDIRVGRPGFHENCSIHGFLSQATSWTGVRFAIARPVVEGAGSVSFGTTNALPVEEWVSSFKTALQANSPQWINDINSKWDKMNPRQENLVLVTNSPKLVLVVPIEWVAEFQQSAAPNGGSAAKDENRVTDDPPSVN